MLPELRRWCPLHLNGWRDGEGCCLVDGCDASPHVGPLPDVTGPTRAAAVEKHLEELRKAAS